MVRPPPSSTLFPYTTLFRSSSLSAFRFDDSSGTSKVVRWELGTKPRSEEHTSELQSRFDLVCRLLLEKKKTQRRPRYAHGPGRIADHTAPARAQFLTHCVGV